MPATYEVECPRLELKLTFGESSRKAPMGRDAPLGRRRPTREARRQRMALFGHEAPFDRRFPWTSSRPPGSSERPFNFRTRTSRKLRSLPPAARPPARHGASPSAVDGDLNAGDILLPHARAEKSPPASRTRLPEFGDGLRSIPCRIRGSLSSTASNS